jgi:hypothetical protein
VPASHPVFQLRIRLEDVNPIVWRRLLVPGAARLPTLHLIFQAAMGWSNAHLHQLRAGDAVYAMLDEDSDEDDLDEEEFTTAQALAGQRRALYEYDFGDGWVHEIVVEDASRVPTALKFAVCLDGQNACPPEDVGGPAGYAEFLSAVTDPEHAEHRDMLEWVGRPFDPSAFDLAAANAALQKVR